MRVRTNGLDLVHVVLFGHPIHHDKDVVQQLDQVCWLHAAGHGGEAHLQGLFFVTHRKLCGWREKAREKKEGKHTNHVDENGSDVDTICNGSLVLLEAGRDGAREHIKQQLLRVVVVVVVVVRVELSRKKHKTRKNKQNTIPQKQPKKKKNKNSLPPALWTNL